MLCGKTIGQQIFISCPKSINCQKKFAACLYIDKHYMLNTISLKNENYQRKLPQKNLKNMLIVLNLNCYFQNILKITKMYMYKMFNSVLNRVPSVSTRTFFLHCTFRAPLSWLLCQRRQPLQQNLRICLRTSRCTPYYW